MASKSPSWAEQWGTESSGGCEENEIFVTKVKGSRSGGSKQMTEVKAAASSGYDKAKSIATAGGDKAKAAAMTSAQKVKSGTSAGINWIKNQYQKKTSK